MTIESQASEARRAIRRAKSSWAALRKQMSMPYTGIDVPGFTPQAEIRAGYLAQAITADGYLARYIAGRLLGEPA